MLPTAMPGVLNESLTVRSTCAKPFKNYKSIRMGYRMVLHEQVGYDATLFQTSVENDNFVVPHFGIILSVRDYDQLAKRLVEQKFYFSGHPSTRFIGEVYEQKVMFLKDPSGNVFEFKCYKHLSPEEWA